MHVNFPKYNKPLLKRVLELLEGDLITTDKTIIGAINELATYLNKIISSGELNFSSLINNIEILQNIVGDENYFYEKGTIVECLQYLQTVTNSTTSQVNNIDLKINGKQDKIDPSIVGEDKSIVSNLNTLIKKKVAVEDVDTLLTKGLTNGVYEISDTNNDNIYILIVQTKIIGSLSVTSYKLIGQTQVGTATSNDDKFTFTTSDYASKAAYKELYNSVNNMQTELGDVPVNNNKSIKSAINDLYAKWSYTSNIVSNTNLEYSFEQAEYPYKGVILSNKVNPGVYRTFANISINPNAESIIGACLVLLTGDYELSDLLTPNLPLYKDAIQGIYSFGEDIQVSETCTLALITLNKEYLQDVLNGSSQELINQPTTINISDIYISSKTSGNEQFIGEVKNDIVDIKNKIGESVLNKGETIINAINRIFLSFNNYKNEVKTTLDKKQNAYNNLSLPTTDKTIVGAITEVHKTLSTLEETVASIDDRVKALEIKITTLENPTINA